MTDQRSHADYIGQYLKLRNFIDASQAAFKARMEPYEKAMETIANHMLSELNAQADGDGKSSIATPQGTAFRKLSTSIKVTSREEFMDFIFDGRREGFLTNHVSSDAVKEYIDQFKATPPGIDVVPFYKIQFNSPREK